ncbi:hypothetical protein HDV00_009778 [Rhizophlyctis rosea]|nr:hypothetical protein HDV00_009778 [Rhizophlyctis rosea]
MPTFEVRPIKVAKKKEQKNYDFIPNPLPKPPLSMLCVASRRSGKSTVTVNLVHQVYSKAFSEVILLSDTIATDKTYAPLAKLENVSCHDIKKHPINNELLQAIWDRQAQRYAQDRKNDLLIVFDDLGTKMKSKDMRAMINKYAQMSRHIGISFINIVQSILNVTSEVISNSTEFIIFRLDNRALTRVSETLATAEKDRKELEAFLKRNTKKKYSWVLINMQADEDEHVFQVYDPDTGKFSAGT